MIKKLLLKGFWSYTMFSLKESFLITKVSGKRLVQETHQNGVGDRR